MGNHQHQKAIKDSRRAKSFAKLIVEHRSRCQARVQTFASPPRRRHPQKAKKTSVPNLEHRPAVKRGSGPAQVAVDHRDHHLRLGCSGVKVSLLIECLTDNKNRAAAGCACTAVMTR
jgi:transcriptional/translational regulatory protein YebC/TACO1